jgi:hypothetical protein
VVPTNNHPFVFGRHAIAHNGAFSMKLSDCCDVARAGEISNIDIVRRGMCAKMTLQYHAAIRGTTDSEVSAFFVAFPS